MATIHTVTIEGSIGETEIYAAAAAALAAGCTHWQIEQRLPATYADPAPTGRWIAATGRAARPMRTSAEAAAISGARVGTDW